MIPCTAVAVNPATLWSEVGALNCHKAAENVWHQSVGAPTDEWA